MLRPYQVNIASRVDSFSGRGNHGVSVLIEAPTGAGKTTIASAMTKDRVERGERVYFVVDSIELIDQTLDRFVADGLRCGVIQADHWATASSAPVQICSVQTLRNRWKDIPDSLRPDTTFIDEAHVIHKTHEEIIKWCLDNNKDVYGLSATPYRKGLGKLFTTLITEVTVRELIEQGYLSPYICYAPYTPDLKGVRTQAGDYAVPELDRIMGDAQVVGQIVETWVRHAFNRRTLIFVPTRAASRTLIEKFVEAGIAAAHVDGETPRAERDEIIRQFRAGEIQVLSNVAVLTKGFDAPEVDCIVFARPTKSLALYRQMVGRGLRTAKGKDNCLILDHSGNVLRCGLPDEPLDLQLDMGDIVRNEAKAGDKPKLPCQACGFLTQFVKCPACEFERVNFGYPDKKVELKAVDGELVFIDAPVSPKPGKYDHLDPADLYNQALWHTRMKGWSDGWAYHFVKGITNQNPPRLGKPAQPTAEVMRLIKYWTIKNAKRKGGA